MTPTEAEQAAGAAALEAQAEGRSFAARLAPHNIWAAGTQAALKAADGAKDQSPAGRQAAGQAALRVAIDATGHGGMVTDQDCHDGAAIVLSAAHKLRALAAEQHKM